MKTQIAVGYLHFCFDYWSDKVARRKKIVKMFDIKNISHKKLGSKKTVKLTDWQGACVFLDKSVHTHRFRGLLPCFAAGFERSVCPILEGNTQGRDQEKSWSGLLMCRTHSWLATARSKDQVPMEVSLGLNGKLRVAGCLVARTRYRLFICRAYSWIAISRWKFNVWLVLEP